MKRHAEVMPHHEGHEDGARWRDAARDVGGDRDRYRGDAPSFNGALHERDGLVPYRSGRAEECRVRPIGYHRVGDVLGERSLEGTWIHRIADEGEKVGCKLADDTLDCQFLEACDREDDVEVTGRTDCRILELVYFQARGACRRGQPPRRSRTSRAALRNRRPRGSYPRGRSPRSGRKLLRRLPFASMSCGACRAPACSRRGNQKCRVRPVHVSGSGDVGPRLAPNWTASLLDHWRGLPSPM